MNGGNSKKKERAELASADFWIAPEELKQKHGRDVVAKSEKSWYELQDAKRSSQGDYAPLIAEHGHCCGKSNGAIVRNADVDCCVVETISACLETATSLRRFKQRASTPSV